MKNNILELFAKQNNLTWQVILMNILFSAFLGSIIYLSYYLTHRGTIYSKKFNVSLVVLTVLTGTVMTVIGNNLALSLGMVGALSIVRFRTAIKDPMDLVFLFWAISVGIACGAGMLEIAIIGSLLLTIIIFLLDRVPVAKAANILVVNASGDAGLMNEINDIVKTNSKYFKVKSRNLSDSALDVVIELWGAKDEELITGLKALEKVHSVSLMAHDGEVTF